VGSANIFKRVFGPEAVEQGADGSCSLTAGAMEIEIVSLEKAVAWLGDAMPHPSGRADYMAALRIRTISLSQTAMSLEVGGIKDVRAKPKRILVPASGAMNVALEFVE
jgi:hypothetical protein